MNETNKLVRTVGFWGLVAMCINAVVGSGVFLLPHESYTLLGAFSLWAPLLFAIPVFILVLNFAEAATYFDEPGGAYLYAQSAFGDFVGFETGWMNWIARVTSLASLSNGFVLALALLQPSLGVGMQRAAVIIAATLILAIIHYLGVRYGAASIYVFTFGKMVPLIGFIIVSLIVWKTNPIPGSFTLPGPGTNWSDAALFMLFAYAGFENLGVPAGEFKNPRRDLPLALFAGIFAIAATYALVQLGAMSALPDLSQSKTPIASAAAELVGPIGAFVVTVGALMSMAGTNSGTMLEGSRLLYALSLGRRMGPLSYVHPRFRTPSVAIAIHTAVALGLALGGSFRQLALISAMARLTTYLVTCLAVPRLRKLSSSGSLGGVVAKSPSPSEELRGTEEPRGTRYRMPGGYLIPILGVAVSLIFVWNLTPQKLLVAAIALTIGAVLYFASKPRVVH